MYQTGPLIFNSRYCTENISTFPEYHLKLIAQKVTCYDTSNILRNLDAIPSLPEDNILCTHMFWVYILISLTKMGW